MKRMFFKDKGRRVKETMDLDITSLLDVLVILLVFLLKSYNASNLKLNLVKNLVVPNSEARKLGDHAIIIQVDSDKKLFINKRQIGSINSYGEHEQLLSELKLMREGSKTEIEKKAKMINLVFDQTLPYKVVKSVMHTSAMAGYTEFKFIVQGNY